MPVVAVQPKIMLAPFKLACCRIMLGGCYGLLTPKRLNDKEKILKLYNKTLFFN